MIMITGATGFLGTQVLHDLVSKGYRVKAIFRDQCKIDTVRKVFRFYGSDIQSKWDQIEWIQGDLLDYYFLMENMQGVAEVYHTAGMVSFNPRDKEKLFQTNVQGTGNVVNACLEQGIEKLCHVSSIASLVEPEDALPVNEELLWNPGAGASEYSVSKLKGEMEVWRGIHEGLQAVIINPAVIIGPGMWNGSGGQILQQVYRGLKFYPLGSGGYVDVRDVSAAMIKLMEGNCFGERYIINGENIAHRDFLNFIADAMQRTRPANRITPLLSRFALMAEAVRAAITGTPARITRKALEIAAETAAYSNGKIVNTLNMSFIPVRKSVQEMVSLFLSETFSKQ
jgi:dihydroflavonol-4-reductase